MRVGATQKELGLHSNHHHRSISLAEKQTDCYVRALQYSQHASNRYDYAAVDEDGWMKTKEENSIIYLLRIPWSETPNGS